MKSKSNPKNSFTTHFRLGRCVAMLASLWMSGAPSFAQANEIPNSTARFTVAPHTPSKITMQALPMSGCVLRAEGNGDTGHSFTVFADDDGVIRFYVNPSEESEQVASFAVNCKAGNQSTKYALELRPSFTPTFDMPAPAVEVRTPRATDSIRPALAKAEALVLSADELLQRGYPVRPDAKRAPEALATWLRAVTRPVRIVNPRLAARPEVHHVAPADASNRENAANWSGFELRGAAGSYDLVEGEWYVPAVSSESNNTTYSSFWIGLDGDGTSDLWQAGTEQTIEDIEVLGLHFDFTSYYAWSEFLPRQATEEVIPNFSVNPGDLMYSQVWVGNQGQSPSLSGSYAIAIVENLSHSESATLYQCRGVAALPFCLNLNQVNIGGSEAEWIMERPAVNGSLPDLADYGSAFMYDAYAEKTNGNWMNYDGANNQQIFMYNGSDLLSAAYPWSTSMILFDWFNFH